MGEQELAARISRLEQISADIDERLVAIEDGLLAARDPLMRLNLRRAEATILALLMKREIINLDNIHTVLYGNRTDPRATNSARVHMANLKKALRVHGVTVMNEHGVGWYISDAGKERVHQLVKEFYQADLENIGAT